MKIAYLGNFGNKFSDATEKHIAASFRDLGHEVIEIDEKAFSFSDIPRADMFLFHKAGETFNVPVEALVQFLTQFTGKKVCWYFDKFWKGREAWAELVIPFVDHFFATDETWLRRHTYDNTHVLRQGIGHTDTSLGSFRKELQNDIVFLGTVYGDRAQFVAGLTEVYKDSFKVVSSSWGRDLYDLCASTKVFVAPKYPQDNFYWSSRVYMVLGSGGFLIHPYLEGLKEEFQNGKHLVMYRDGKELKEKIDYYLKNDTERDAIRLAGYELVVSKYTYKERVKALLQTVNA